MPTARYGEASHASMVAELGAVHASNPLPVNAPGATCAAATANDGTGATKASDTTTDNAPVRHNVLIAAP